MSERIICIAHRGASGTRPENTLASFRRAIELGADAVETDLRATADGAVVLMHDAKVDRTTNGSGPLSSLTLEQVRALDAGSWFAPEFAGERVPTLDEFVSLTAEKVPAHLELKEPGLERQAVDALRRGHPRSVITSFHDESLARVRELDPEARLSLIVSMDPPSDEEIARIMKRVEVLGAVRLAVSYRGVTPAVVETARRAGVGVIAWTIDQPDDMRRMIDLGVAGITSNHPERLIAVLGAPGA